ncbi:MAG: tyrosine-type recombinase/integrase [Novosphingobium sp.]|nr:tyrosine-type recombinase/integrase [Novosphingobium sp.]
MIERANPRVSAEDFAVLRAVLQGMLLRDAAARYWSPELTLPEAKRRFETLRVSLLAAARRAGHFGDARALALDMAALPTAKSPTGPPRPSFEEFVARVDPDGFYSQAEALELYAQQYPPDNDERRRAQVARLRDRQRRALTVLEPVLVQRPVACDPLDTWIDQRLAARLASFEIRTPGDLVAAINQGGPSWYRRIPGVGRIAADKLITWLQANELTIAARIEAAALIPRAQLIEAVRTAQPVHAVVPLEKLALPAPLDGHDGTNRAPDACQIGAVNDLAAIAAWLAARAAGSPHTERAYRKEAERLLLWAVFARGRAMSSINVDDAIAYRDFLLCPFPRETWVGSSSAPRFSPQWRPFTGPLSAPSVGHALTVVRSMFDWLVAMRYLAFNPFVAVPAVRAADPAAVDPTLRLSTDRYLSGAQWRMLREYLDDLAVDEAGIRARFAIVFAYTTGLRASELVTATVGRLRVRLTADDPSWDYRASPSREVALRVVGKGGKVRDVPVAPELEELLDVYLDARRLPSWQRCEPDTPIISALDEVAPGRAISTSSLYRMLRSRFDELARSLNAQQLREDSDAFERASTHWLRHTFGRHALADGASLNVVQAVLGHASVQTTTIYSSGPAEQAHQQLRTFVMRRMRRRNEDAGQDSPQDSLARGT